MGSRQPRKVSDGQSRSAKSFGSVIADASPREQLLIARLIWASVIGSTRRTLRRGEPMIDHISPVPAPAVTGGTGRAPGAVSARPPVILGR
ncbi:hypothetical protein GCM10009679_50880 [Saccharothrix algeriensis]|uniref:Uncharacterized protein n=1 Tax=Catellatospora bangladeshensis TaxID=310355 RepID=A0A8J3NM95_9ACTN|nr:hypothetical protein Cba03nite_63200 [Catellatospora bangladeshensis]